MTKTRPLELFVDRQEELSFLDRAYRSGRANLIVILGRRRTGKTELLRRFLDGKRAAFIYCRQAPVRQMLASVSRDLALAMGDDVLSASPPPDADSALRLLRRYCETPGRPVVVFDEFQNLAARSREFNSLLQFAWDSHLRHSRATIILCGSSVGMMEDLVLSSKAPLYGRKTGRIDLRPLPFWAIGAMAPEKALMERLLRFAVTGGVPHYLANLRRHPRLQEALEVEVMRPGSALYDEPLTALFGETREPDRYLALLEALASGAARPGEIADKSGIRVHELPPYLRVLTDALRLVERRVPLTERAVASRNGRYRVSDPFFRFWFACVGPQRSLIESGAFALAAEMAVRRLPELAGPILEDIVRDAMVRSLGTSWGGVRLRFDDIGAWWNREGVEIDVVALDKRRAGVAVEVKLGIRPVEAAVVEALLEKCQLVPVPGPLRPLVVTAGTFAEGVQQRAAALGVGTVDGRQFGKILNRLVARRSTPRGPVRPQP